MPSIYPTLSQVTYWGVGDIDECSILATYWAARAAGYQGALPTIRAFRLAAGVPDRPGPTGLTNQQVARGIAGTALATMQPMALAGGTSWDAFSATIKAGAFASIAVDASKLPTTNRYGFLGGHRVGVTFAEGQWYIADPLARNGSAPLVITEAALRAAATSFGRGSVSGILFKGSPGASVNVPLPSIPPTVQVLPIGKTEYISGIEAGSFYRGRHGTLSLPGTGLLYAVRHG